MTFQTFDIYQTMGIETIDGCKDFGTFSIVEEAKCGKVIKKI